MLGSGGSAGSAGVESPDDANETCALMRSTGLWREPGDAVASGDVARSCNSTAPLALKTHTNCVIINNNRSRPKPSASRRIPNSKN